MRISIREAFLAKKPSRPIESNWKLIKRAGEDGWTDEFMQEQGLKEKHASFRIWAVVLSVGSPNVTLSHFGSTVRATDLHLDYWLLNWNDDSEKTVLLQAPGNIPKEIVEAIQKAVEEKWDGSDDAKISI